MFLFMLCPSLTLLRHVTGYSCTGYRHLCNKAPFYLTDWTPLDITTTWFPVSVPFPLTFLCMPLFCFSIVPVIHSPLLLYIKVVLLRTYSLVQISTIVTPLLILLSLLSLAVGLRPDYL